MDALGVSKPMRLTRTPHPGLDLLDYGDLSEFVRDDALRRLADELRQNPFAYAFLQGDGEDDAEGSLSEPKSLLVFLT